MLSRKLQLRALGIIVFLAACDAGDVLGPNEIAESFIQQMDLASFEQVVLSSPAQVEVELLPGGLTAHELAVRYEGLSHEERISSRIVALQADDVAGNLTVVLGELTVSFDAETRFWIRGTEVERAVFFREVQAGLTEGHEPSVVAERAAPDTPQDPEDGTFVADGVALTGEGEPNLRMNVDLDNLELLTVPQDGEPDGWLLVLGLRIQLRVRDGTTEIERHQHELDEVARFEGRVRTVALDAGTFTLENGAVIHIVDRTEVMEGEGLLGGLRAVAEALEAGHPVWAWGMTAKAEDGERTIALKVAFKVREVEGPQVVEFEGVVARVDAEGGKLALSDGTVVRVTDRTEVVAHDDGSPSSLEGVQRAMEAGRTVVAWGRGEVEGREPLTLEALRMVLKLRPVEEPHPDQVEFEGVVASVNLTEGSFMFANGTVVRLFDGTGRAAFDDHSPATLEGVAAAIEAGRIVHAWGLAEVAATEPRTLDALRVVFKTPIEDFERAVVSVDLENRTFTLDGDIVVKVTDETELRAGTDASPNTLEGAKAAIDVGISVRARGWGFVAGREPLRIEGREVTFTVTLGG